MQLVFWFENLNKKWAARSKVLHSPSPQNGLMILGNDWIIKGTFIETTEKEIN